MTVIDPPGSFVFYDLETSGLDARGDRIMQFAGLRTDPNLQPMDDGCSTYVKLPIDILPNPQSCLITGLTPQRVNAEGMEEFEAYDMIERMLAVPGTCTVGFNNLRFDDEFLRFAFYRHFIDPYAREFRDGNSRWDVIDLMRATAALRPDGIVWPEQDGLPSFRLEVFTAANGLEHGHAHDAMSDVTATLAAARLLKSAQPRLFDYYLTLRRKAAVLDTLRPRAGQACVHVSGRLPRERRGLGIVLPVVVRSDNSNSVVAIDVSRDFAPFARMSAAELREALFTPGDHDRPPIKEIRVNRCPFVAPLNVMRPTDCERLDIDLDRALAQADELARDTELAARLLAVYSPPVERDVVDADAALYEGFFSDADRARCLEVRRALRDGRPPDRVSFDDERLTELLFRLDGRRSETDFGASPGQRQQWRESVGQRFAANPGTNDVVEFRDRIETLQGEDSAERDLKRDLEAHATHVEKWLEGGAGG